MWASKHARANTPKQIHDSSLVRQRQTNSEWLGYETGIDIKLYNVTKMEKSKSFRLPSFRDKGQLITERSL